MEPAGLAALPVELIHHISRYLSAQDVLSCSSTCLYLRAALNDNCVWRKYLPQDCSGLETQEQQVSPRLEMGEGLTPLCEMRQQFTRKTHLMNNWRAGNCVQYSSSSEIKEFDRVMLPQPDQANALYKDKYVFIERSIDDITLGNTHQCIEIWDISNVPVVVTCFHTDRVFYSFYIVGSHLIITQYRRILVYHITLPDKDFPLLYSFLVTDINVTFKQIVTNGYAYLGEEWGHSFVRNYLMSSNPEEGRLHIWNIDTASKVGSFEPPVKTYRISLCSFTGNICVLGLKSQFCTVPNYLVTFNLENNQFSNNRFGIKKDKKYDVIEMLPYNNFVTLIKVSKLSNCDGLYVVICTLYDFNTTLKLREKSFTTAEECVLPSPVVNGTYIIACHDGLHVINASTLDVVNTFNYYNPSIISYFSIYNNLIAVGINKKLMLDLWDVNKKDALLRDVSVTCTSNLYLDSLCTKLVIIDDKKVTVLHMW